MSTNQLELNSRQQLPQAEETELLDYSAAFNTGLHKTTDTGGQHDKGPTQIPVIEEKNEGRIHLEEEPDPGTGSWQSTPTQVHLF